MNKQKTSSNTILIIEDDKINLETLLQYLQNQQDLSLNLLAATSGEEGIQITEQVHPDLILLDVVMPLGIGGFEVCRILKANNATHDIPIIFMTALTETNNKVKGFRLGGADYITKPVQYEELLARVNTHLLIHKQQEELKTEISRRENLEAAREKTHLLLQQAIKSQANNSPELKRYQTELKHCQTKLETFVHTVANDLKQPLDSLLTLCSSLEQNSSTTMPLLLHAESIQTLQKMRTMGEQAGNVMNFMLFLGELFQDKPAKFALFDTDEIVTTVIEKRLASMIQQYQAKIKLAEIWPSVPGVRLWLEEIWINYISNALKYGGKPPHLELGAAPFPPDFVRFWVRDNGEGITSVEQERLFKPFDLQQLQVKEDGLGLSMVQHLVEKLGGSVGVESTKGKGSLFYFILPAY
ncbi:MAG: hybrid sensor histidine kinase/response regulator [Candidatus Parabeggiatoa sp. nov. 3]|nr:MAG: hybrid sensor histidine kinase/response regulator [Gammaproteobacteria bacterium]RKZ87109.1 MAG: hybrid sensor histidine kinase/response regulator [Gammaproteobacteria bacterium]